MNIWKNEKKGGGGGWGRKRRSTQKIAYLSTNICFNFPNFKHSFWTSSLMSYSKSGSVCKGGYHFEHYQQQRQERKITLKKHAPPTSSFGSNISFNDKHSLGTPIVSTVCRPAISNCWFRLSAFLASSRCANCNKQLIQFAY